MWHTRKVIRCQDKKRIVDVHKCVKHDALPDMHPVQVHQYWHDVSWQPGWLSYCVSSGNLLRKIRVGPSSKTLQSSELDQTSTMTDKWQSDFVIVCPVGVNVSFLANSIYMLLKACFKNDLKHS